MSIPKKISYCWFGGKPLPDIALKCIESWKIMCPGYEIIRWDENNYDVEKIPYIRDAYKEKKWAFVADYARLDIIYNEGGIYLDTDVELLKSLDCLLDKSAFMGIEKAGLLINTGLGFGALAGNKMIKQIMNLYEQASFYNLDGSLNLKACTVYVTDYFKLFGYRKEDIKQCINNITIYPSKYFCPIDFDSGVCNITDDTIGIHWYDASWFPKSDKKIHDVEIKIKKNFPETIAKILCKVYRNSYRFCEYTAEGRLIEKIKKKVENK